MIRYFLFLFCFLFVGYSFGQKITIFPYFEDFENGPAGWVASGTANTWAFGTPAKSTIQGASSGTKAWVTGGLGGGQYNNNENSAVLSPEFDFSNMQQPVVQLRVWWNNEFSWDGAAFQATTNNGGTWLTIGTTNSPGNWYTDNTINGNPGGQQQGWSGRASSGNGSNGWVTAKHGTNALIGKSSVKFRVAFGSDGSVQDDGFAFDDVLLFDRRAKDVGILDIASPVQDCGFGGTYDVEIDLRNFGFEVADSFSLAYQINNDAPVIEAYTGSVGSDMNFTYTFSQQAVLNQNINYSISTWLIWPQDEENSNDSILNQGLKNVMPFGPTSFEGFFGKNIANVLPGWNEGKGNNPNIIKSKWTESDTIQTQFYGVATAKIKLTGSGVNDWLLTPSFVVPQPSRMFYSIGVTAPGDTVAAIMGDDDFIKVRVSIDCGSTWSDLKTYVKADNLGPDFQEEVLILDPFVGQEIIIGIQANTVLAEPESFDFHVSLQEARFVYPDDLGISAFRLGNGLPIMQAGSGDIVFYTIKNFGSNSVPNIPVLAYVGNSLFQHIQYSPLPQNQEVEIQAGGYWAYSNGPATVPVKIFTMVANDTINNNDTLFSFITVLGVTGFQNGIDESGVSIFPNPSKGNFQIVFGRDVFFDQLEILGPTGKSILSRNLEKGIDGISLGLESKNLTPGVYFLRLFGTDHSKTLELVIK
jgi:hypothetical protein